MVNSRQRRHEREQRAHVDDAVQRDGADPASRVVTNPGDRIESSRKRDVLSRKRRFEVDGWVRALVSGELVLAQDQLLELRCVREDIAYHEYEEMSEG